MRSDDPNGSMGSDRLEQLYEKALQLQGEERSAFLDDECAADADLRAEIESLLAHADDAESFIRDVTNLVDPAGESMPERMAEALAGRYTIEREIGQGGMATVYLARDVRHQRDVALKVLHPELAAVIGGERFLNEIRITANLQHPHILPLFDSGSAGSFLFFVTPYIDGESLRDRLAREKQLPLEDALRIASEVAEALDHAHRQGVVHRDIKPANILLRDGRAVVADFGIAIAVHAAGGSRLTATGLSLGTPSYMSPEQATGEHTVDGRTDIYALGCVLYEMLAGQPPFTAPSLAGVLSKVLSGRPAPIRSLRESVPPAIEATVDKALARLPADRFQTPIEFADMLTGKRSLDPDQTGFAVAATTAAGATGVASRFVKWAGVAAITAIALWGWLRTPEPDPTTASRTVIRLAEDQRLSFGTNASRPIAISPDGQHVVYVAELDDGPQLALRAMDDFEATPIPGTEGATQPFFSPDGLSVGFFASRELRTVPIAGGSRPLVVTAIEGVPLGASWGEDGRIVFAINGAGLFGVPMAGGEPAAIPLRPSSADSAVGDTVVGPYWPQLLSDARALLTGGGVWLANLATGEARKVVPSVSAVSASRYLRTGHIMYAEIDGTVRLLPFDLDRLEATGPPTPALDGLARGMAGGVYAFDVAQTGTLVYATAGFDRSLVLLDREGRPTPIAIEPRAYRWPRLSPEGDRILVSGADPTGTGGLYLVDIQRAIADRIWSGPPAAWAPDGQRIAVRIDGEDIVALRLAGSDEPHVLAEGPFQDTRFGLWIDDWSGDGQRLLLNRTPLAGGGEFMALDVTGDGTPVPFFATSANAFGPKWAPNGRYFTYAGDETGTHEVYIVGYPEPGRPLRVSREGGEDPHWTDSGVIIYRRGYRMMAVDVQTDPTLEIGEPRVLFDADYDYRAATTNWDVSDDGQTFVMIRGDPATTRELKIVQNWFDELATRR